MAAPENKNFIYQFNNKSKSNNSFVLYIVAGLVLIGSGFLFLAKSWYYLLIADSIATILFFLIFNTIKPLYLEFLVTERNVRFNFYSVASTMRNYNTIEIPLENLKAYQVRKKFWGLKKELIVSISTKYGIADYPPISISLLNKNEINQILHVLQKIIDN